jgi:hypothetical protein
MPTVILVSSTVMSDPLVAETEQRLQKGSDQAGHI